MVKYDGLRTEENRRKKTVCDDLLPYNTVRKNATRLS